MKIWTPEECKTRYIQTHEHYGKLHPITAFRFSNYWLPSRLDILTRSYSHDPKYVLEALDLIEWPMDQILNNLDIYLLGDPSYDHYNGSAGTNFTNVDGVRVPNGHVLLFGRSTPIPRYMTHYILVHEIGHVVQETYCRDDSDLCKEYLELRRVTDTDSNEWTNDWKQLWAEDWRWIFSHGTAHQDSWSMEYPKPDKAIKYFMLELIN